MIALCIFGTPSGIQAHISPSKFPYEGDATTIVDWGHEGISFLPDVDVFVIRRIRDSNGYITFLGVYRQAYEINARRVGTYYGAGLLWRDEYVVGKLAVQAATELADALKTVSLSEGRFICNIREAAAKIALPASCQALLDQIAANSEGLVGPVPSGRDSFFLVSDVVVEGARLIDHAQFDPAYQVFSSITFSAHPNVVDAAAVRPWAERDVYWRFVDLLNKKHEESVRLQADSARMVDEKNVLSDALQIERQALSLLHKERDALDRKLVEAARARATFADIERDRDDWKRRHDTLYNELATLRRRSKGPLDESGGHYGNVPRVSRKRRWNVMTIMWLMTVVLLPCVVVLLVYQWFYFGPKATNMEPAARAPAVVAQPPLAATALQDTAAISAATVLTADEPVSFDCRNYPRRSGDGNRFEYKVNSSKDEELPSIFAAAAAACPKIKNCSTEALESWRSLNANDIRETVAVKGSTITLRFPSACYDQLSSRGNTKFTLRTP